MRLPPAAREDAVTLLEGVKDPEMRAALIRLLATVRRAEIKTESDREGDRQRRTLIGAHVPRWRADQYKAIAKDRHLSLHAWICQTLDQAAAEQGAGRLIDGPADGPAPDPIESSHQIDDGGVPA